ncbi:MAG: nuclear transport factor 2 family protein [Actinomycetota bacterium]
MAEHPNVARLKKGYDAFASGDLDALKGLFADDILWHVPGNNPLAGDYKGQDEVFGFFAKIAQETGGTFKLELHDVLANDEHAVVLVRVSAERNGKRLDGEPGVQVFHTNPDGKTTEFWGFSQDSAKIDEFWS